MQLGTISKYEVVRETNLGYTLIKNDVEYFLHYNECNGRTLKIGEKVDAFLYLDKKNRPACTLFPPKITLNKCGFVDVIESKIEVGVFVNIGISKDILVSKDDLPIDNSQWPIKGDKLLCQLKIKGNKLIAKLLSKNEILDLPKNDELLPNIKVKGYIYRIVSEGVNIITEDYDIIFVYYTNLRKRYRIGEEVEVKIIQKNDDDYNGSLIENKEFMIDDDANSIMEFLVKNKGVMPYTSNSEPDMIYRVFKMSKRSFKRALGHLYKEKKILLEEDKTILL